MSQRSVLGPTLSALLMRWLRQIIWPDTHAIHPDDPGITYVELAVSFMKFACCYLPVKRAKQDGILHFFLPATASEAQANNAVLSELGPMMSYLLHQMEQLVSPSFMPVNPVVACKGL